MADHSKNIQLRMFYAIVIVEVSFNIDEDENGHKGVEIESLELVHYENENNEYTSLEVIERFVRTTSNKDIMSDLIDQIDLADY